MYGKMNLILIMAAEKNQEESKKNQLLTLPVNVWHLQRKCHFSKSTQSFLEKKKFSYFTGLKIDLI